VSRIYVFVSRIYVFVSRIYVFVSRIYVFVSRITKTNKKSELFILELYTYSARKRRYIPQYGADEGFKQPYPSSLSINAESLEISTIVPLNFVCIMHDEYRF